MFKYIFFSVLFVLLLGSSSQASIETELVKKQVGKCTIEITHLANIDPEYKTASLNAYVSKKETNCDITAEEFLKVLGQVLDSLKKRKDLKPVDAIYLGSINGPPFDDTQDEILLYYKNVIPNELEKALQISGRYKLHSPTLDPLIEHLNEALLSTEFYSKLKMQLDKSRYTIRKLGFEKFMIWNKDNQKIIDVFIWVYINEINLKN